MEGSSTGFAAFYSIAMKEIGIWVVKIALFLDAPRMVSLLENGYQMSILLL